MFATLRKNWLPHYYCGIAIIGMILLALGFFILKIRYDASYEKLLEFNITHLTSLVFGDNAFRYIFISFLFSIILGLRYFTKSFIFRLLIVILSILAFIQYWIIIRNKMPELYPESEYLVWVVITLIADAAIIGCAFYGALKFPIRDSVK